MSKVTTIRLLVDYLSVTERKVIKCRSNHFLTFYFHILFRCVRTVSIQATLVIT